jgi:DNA-binding response OmpR family regulator
MTNKHAILIVGDEVELRNELVTQLAFHKEFSVGAASNGAKVTEGINLGEIDLLVLDAGLAITEGRETVRIVRDNGFKGPVILLSDSLDSNFISGLESGVIDCITKPFRFAILLARIRAQLRQHDASENDIFSIGHYIFNPSSKILLSQKGYKIRLTEKETAILQYLYRAGLKSVSREKLLQEVWGYNSGVTTHTLETHIYRLRQKVEKDAAQPQILMTEGGGYKLVP